MELTNTMHVQVVFLVLFLILGVFALPIALFLLIPFGIFQLIIGGYDVFRWKNLSDQHKTWIEWYWGLVALVPVVYFLGIGFPFFPILTLTVCLPAFTQIMAGYMLKDKKQ